MKKVAVIVDSFSGKSKQEVEDLGLFHIYQSIIIDGKEYRDGIDIFLEKDWKMIEKASNIKSSMPPLGIVIELFENLSKEYEEVYFLPMNKGMSGTFASAFNAAKDFKNVHVLENKFCGTAIIEAALLIKKMSNENKSVSEITKTINDLSAKSIAFVLPKVVDGIIRSGRVTGLKKVILEKAKLIPILFVGENGFQVKGLKRNFERSLQTIFDEIIKLIKGEKNFNKYNFEILHCGSVESISIVKKLFASFKIENFLSNWTNSPVAGYTGMDAIGINLWEKINYK